METETEVKADADSSCKICKGDGWHDGWNDVGFPVRLRCPCVDRVRSSKKSSGMNPIVAERLKREGPNENERLQIREILQDISRELINNGVLSKRTRLAAEVLLASNFFGVMADHLRIAEVVGVPLNWVAPMGERLRACDVWTVNGELEKGRAALWEGDGGDVIFCLDALIAVGEIEGSRDTNGELLYRKAPKDLRKKATPHVAAIQSGQTTYEGGPCCRCGHTVRRVGSGACMACYGPKAYRQDIANKEGAARRVTSAKPPKLKKSVSLPAFTPEPAPVAAPPVDLKVNKAPEPAKEEIEREDEAPDHEETAALQPEGDPEPGKWPLWRMEDWQCRWPCSPFGDRNVLFCGAVREGKGPYCHEHRQKA